MVRKNTLKTKISRRFSIVLFAFSLLISPLITEQQSFAACTTTKGKVTCSSSTTFNVGVNEILTVAITRPASWASGSINTFLTNKVGVSIVSNNPDGFTATMKSAATTPNLVNLADDSSIIPTLSSQATLADSTDSTNVFPVNKWGTNVVDGGASAPSEYGPVRGSNDAPSIIASTSTIAGTVEKDIYFAAKAGSNMPSGTYANEVIISVVAGVVDSSEVNPVTPNDDIANDGTSTEVASGNTPHGTVVTTTTEEETTTTESYAKPAGATERTTAVINEGTPLATGLAITAGIAAVAGIIFFIIAKRQRDDDEDDELGDY